MRIGAHRVIDARRLLIPVGELAEYTVQLADNSPFKIRVQIDSAEKIPEGNSSLSWNGGPGFVHLRFKTNSIIPQVTRDHQLATMPNGSPLLFIGEFFRPNPGMGVVFIQLMVLEPQEAESAQ